MHLTYRYYDRYFFSEYKNIHFIKKYAILIKIIKLKVILKVRELSRKHRDSSFLIKITLLRF